MSFTKGKKIATAKYEGIYSYGSNPEKEHTGSVFVYPETDSTVLVSLSICRGAPSYNLGATYGRVHMVADSGIYYDNDSNNCRFLITFSPKAVTIKSLDKRDCFGFGYGVYPDGIFYKKKDKVGDFFIGMQGDTIYYKTPLEK